MVRRASSCRAVLHGAPRDLRAFASDATDARAVGCIRRSAAVDVVHGLSCLAFRQDICHSATNALQICHFLSVSLASGARTMPTARPRRPADRIPEQIRGRLHRHSDMQAMVGESASQTSSQASPPSRESDYRRGTNSRPPARLASHSPGGVIEMMPTARSAVLVQVLQRTTRRIRPRDCSP